MTHRMFSRNAASSRAIPIRKMIENVKNDPAMPVYWGMNQTGMQAGDELSYDEIRLAKEDWLAARDQAIKNVEHLQVRYNLHKQIANRLLEPWMFITVIMTCTDISNFFDLRLHKDAQPEIRALAVLMKREYDTSVPTEGIVHIPMAIPSDEELSDENQFLAAVGRLARVSYLTHEGTRDTSKDIELAQKLMISGHWSPFEHVAIASPLADGYIRNFKGWRQYRSMVDQPKELLNANHTS